MKALIGAALAAALALPAGMATVLVGGTAMGAAPASAQALADIPSPLMGAYRAAAATCPGLPWTVLAAIGKVETDHGRAGGAQLGIAGRVAPPIVGVALDGANGTAHLPDTDGGRLDGDPSFDRAVGPMQFLPATWARWGRDASGDGLADIDNTFDAIASAGAYLCGETGQVTDVAAAVATYNRSPEYVERVLSTAAGYGSVGSGGALFAGPEPISQPGLALSAAARADLASGQVDDRVVAVLGVISERFAVDVSVIRTSHSQCVGGGSPQTRPGCAESEHWNWRAVDIAAVGGHPVTATNPAAAALAEFLLALAPPLRPDELGVPWAALSPIPGVFADADHQDHLHLGWSANPAGIRPA